MAEGARWAVEHGATIVDINMGCPVDKVTKKDGGSALLTDVSRAARLAARVRQELDRIPLSREEWAKRVGDSVLLPPGDGPVAVPLTCKIRLCWSTADYEAGQACSPFLASALADGGVAAVTVHGRTTEMRFLGHVQLPGIARVVEQIGGRIPVIGNGDVKEPADAVRMVKTTGCAGVMIGRGALSTPWIFRDCCAALDGARVPEMPSEAEKIAIMRRYFDLMRQYREEKYALWQINRRVSWFAKRMGYEPDGSRFGMKPFREAIRISTTPEMVYEAMERYVAGELKGGPVYEADAEEAGV
jgi:tRNA-dihydrouridine synthase